MKSLPLLVLIAGLLAGIGYASLHASPTTAPATSATATATAPAPTLAAKLAAKVTVGGWNMDPLPKTLTALLREFDIEYTIADAEFARSGIDPAKRLVAYGQQRDVPLSSVLDLILNQVPAKYRLSEDGKTLIIRPKP